MSEKFKVRSLKDQAAQAVGKKLTKETSGDLKKIGKISSREGLRHTTRRHLRSQLEKGKVDQEVYNRTKGMAIPKELKKKISKNSNQAGGVKLRKQ